jgi:hypothetical protein
MPANAVDEHLVAEFCSELTELAGEADELGIVAELKAAMTALASGAAAPAEAVRQFWAATGLAESTRTVPIPGQDPTPPPPGDYICPNAVCDRREDRVPGGPMPVCHIYRESMKYQP